MVSQRDAGGGGTAVMDVAPPSWCHRSRGRNGIRDAGEPALTDEGWRFGDYPGSDRDALNGATYIHEICTRVDPHYTGRATIPVLWDKQRKTIVNNESADIVRMFDAGFGTLASRTFDLYARRRLRAPEGGEGR